jgi:hypothetical protein
MESATAALTRLARSGGAAAGCFPGEERLRWLLNPTRTPDKSWSVLRAAGVTHVVLHTGAWDDRLAAR